MPERRYLKPERVAAAVSNLAAWRGDVRGQAATHLWPLLALVRAGANKQTRVLFEERNDFEFWNEYMRLPGDQRPVKDENDQFQADYYVDPLARQFRKSDYPHHSPATVRIKTFARSWRAADYNENDRTWRLAEDFAENYAGRLERGGELERVPVVDLAVWLFRGQKFPGNADARNLERKFRDTFPFEDGEYYRLFSFLDEVPDRLFTAKQPSAAELAKAIEGVLLDPNAPPPDPPPVKSGGESNLPDDDSVLVQVKALLEMGTSGIIFRGCPGTSKTWYAKQIAHKLVADPKAHLFQCQFHPSYGYEDFVEGYRPDQDSKSGFKVVDKVFLNACDVARQPENAGKYVVFIIDEINRGDPARVFGELLTYVEHGYRGDEFSKTYTGDKTSIPKNLIVFGTMNQHDRSISQLDIALTRRFDHIDLKPDAEVAEEFLSRSGNFTGEQIAKVVKWFESLQVLLKPIGIGHTFFKDVTTTDQLRLVWLHRMRPYCESVLELHADRLKDVRSSFDGMFRAVAGQGGP